MGRLERMFERMVRAIVIGAISGFSYHFFTKDVNGTYVVAIIVGQVIYHGSKGEGG